MAYKFYTGWKHTYYYDWLSSGVTFEIISVDHKSKTVEVREKWYNDAYDENIDKVTTQKISDGRNTEYISMDLFTIWADDIEDDREYTPSATRGDYSPSHPWDAPGMSISDFI